MKRNRINRDRRLLEALDYLDEAYIADVVDNLKVPPVPGAPLPKKGRILRSLKPVAMLVACTLLLAALIPAVTYMTSHIPDIVAFFRGEQSEATVPEETDPIETDPTVVTDPTETQPTEVITTTQSAVVTDPTAPVEDEDAADVDSDAAPKEEKAPWLVIGIVIGAVVLIGGGIALFLFLRKKK